MIGPELEGFLRVQFEKGMALAARSDILELEALGAPPVQTYMARFRARGLVREGNDVVEWDQLEVGIHFGANYLRHVDPAQLLTLCAPVHAWHSNIRMPFICPGVLRPGTELPDLLYQLYDIWSWRNYSLDESDTMNLAACSWARAHRDRFPTDPRPLCRPRSATEDPR
jgi:hypothetical protein